MSNKTLFTKNIRTLSAAGITLKEFMAMKPEAAQKLVDDLSSTDSIDLETTSEEVVEDNIYLNIDIEVNGRPCRISGIRLDSDYVQFLDKEHTKVNKVAASLLQTINNKGVAYCNEHAVFKVTIQKQGESNIEVTDNLF